MSDDATRPYLVDRIYPAEEVHLIGGPSGAGKTTMVFQMLEDLSHGRPIFDQPSHPTPFCYIACDRSLPSVKETVARVNPKFPHPLNLISLVNSPSIPRTMAGIVSHILSRTPDCKLFVLDGIHSLCPKGKINDYDVVSSFLIDSTHICQSKHVTCLDMGHAAKVKEHEAFRNPRHSFLGSVAWGGFSDTMLLIDPLKPEDPSDSTRNIFLLPRNDAGQLLQYEYRDGRLALCGNDIAEFILDNWFNSLAVGKTVMTSEIEAQGKSLKLSRATVHRWLKDAAASGKLLKAGHGVYQKRTSQ